MTELESVRARVLEFVRRYPATHAREVERRLGLTDRLGAYHLSRLVSLGLVREVREKGYRRFWAADATPNLRGIRIEKLLRRRHAYRIMLLLLETEELAQGDIAHRLGLAPATTSYHLRLLHDAGLVTVREQGRNRYYSATNPPKTRASLAALPPLPGRVDEFSQLWDDLVR